jgi:hypothetical protein
MFLRESLKNALWVSPGQSDRPHCRVESLKPTYCSLEDTGLVKLAIADVLDLYSFVPKEVG